MKRFFYVILALLLGVTVLLLGAWQIIDSRLEAFLKTPYGTTTVKTVVVPTGTNPKKLSQLLEKEDVVSSGTWLYYYLRQHQLGPKLKAGEYEFTGPLSPLQALEAILAGKVKQYHYTIPEGLRVDEILPLIANSELHLSLSKLESLARSGAFVHKLGIPAETMEGFLFPDTYSFPRGANEEMVLAKMATRSIEEAQNAKRKTGVDLNLLQTMTLASIVEKETGAPEERPRIACVFHNRLRLGMRLQTDPTVIYAMMLLKGHYSKNITRVDLETKHPYNTYTEKGLPPGPIASPGSAAIQAALNPIECDDLFFVSRNDGTHVFCPTLECHEANVQKWQVEFFKKKKN